MDYTNYGTIYIYNSSLYIYYNFRIYYYYQVFYLLLELLGELILGENYIKFYFVNKNYIL